MKFEIRRAKNGIILKAQDDEEIVCHERYDKESLEYFADFLRIIDENYGPITNRYSDERIYIRLMPGDKSKKSEEIDMCLLKQTKKVLLRFFLEAKEKGCQDVIDEFAEELLYKLTSN